MNTHGMRPFILFSPTFRSSISLSVSSLCFSQTCLDMLSMTTTILPCNVMQSLLHTHTCSPTLTAQTHINFLLHSMERHLHFTVGKCFNPTPKNGNTWNSIQFNLWLRLGNKYDDTTSWNIILMKKSIRWITPQSFIHTIIWPIVL